MRNVFGAVNEQLEDLRLELELTHIVDEAVEAFEAAGYELDDDLTLDDLIEAAEEWLESEAAEDMQEKVGGFGFKFSGKDKGGKKTPSGMKMVFGRLVKIGKQFARKLGFGKAKVKPRRPALKPLAKKPLAKKRPALKKKAKAPVGQKLKARAQGLAKQGRQMKKSAARTSAMRAKLHGP